MRSRLAEELGSGRVYEKATKQDLPAKPIRRRAQSEAACLLPIWIMLVLGCDGVHGVSESWREVDSLLAQSIGQEQEKTARHAL